MCAALTVEAPCKVNIHLRVLGRRSDGYHNLESIFLALSFGDILRFEVFEPHISRPDEIRIQPELPAGDSSIAKAVSLFRSVTGFSGAVKIEAEKRIPLGAGLGGGSSDAAATLMVLNRLSGLFLPERELQRMALQLGSDVPFFLRGGAAYVTGRGEIIEPLDPPEHLWIVLVNPGIFSGTPEAFALMDRNGDTLWTQQLPKEELVRALSGDPASWPYRNDFLALFLSRGTAAVRDGYTRILEELEALGADFAGLSGSGSTCFGVFKDKRVAEKAEKALISRWSFAQMTFPLARTGITVLKC
ncbi:4-(cytidine 5'-diphospho)-2-C-methyl-D-erythritol kinase [Breznakiella homolactica]|uniref:4-diphosphocytidyl-2-C-methyl-D-erythritol kinase n=1 Tax=Breznakiella homolactica TaxID=2798577 RepID=A0A7T7XRG7_9SPIR|nr:4-(cytidine 5'-diphospho)-2-C-methyl-D-erythritol kinase [Breznakiella homolactica]QQO11142.1 4-(cytidine 5'-diphospho)-2-C-methyl-D-erythritol kinase [Breznakiella homolactica]